MRIKELCKHIEIEISGLVKKLPSCTDSIVDNLVIETGFLVSLLFKKVRKQWGELLVLEGCLPSGWALKEVILFIGFYPSSTDIVSFLFSSGLYEEHHRQLHCKKYLLSVISQLFKMLYQNLNCKLQCQSALSSICLHNFTESTCDQLQAVTFLY